MNDSCQCFNPFEAKKEPKVLHLTLKKVWFDLIKSDKKKEEYREVKPYWCARFVFVNGEKKTRGWWDSFFKFSDRAVKKCRGLVVLEMIKNGQAELERFDEILFSNGIKLDQASTVVDAEKFLESHINYLDGQQRAKKNGGKVCDRQVRPHFGRLLKYLKQYEKELKEKKN